jgi:nucleotide-binding universal stress UspA family protein
MAGAIVVGFDGGECADSALDTAMELARRFEEPLLIVFGAGPPGSVGEEYREHRRAIEEIGERVTSAAVERAREGGVEVELVISHERAHEALIATARARDARFIVVGSYGERPLKGAILGSVPHKLLHLAETPVVVVRV